MALKAHLEVVAAGAEALREWHRQNPGVPLQLRRADFQYGCLDGFDLRGAKLELADFRWCDLIGANLSGADLTRADFHKAELRDATLVDCNLTETNLEDAILIGSNLEGATLSHTRFNNTNLTGVRGLTAVRHASPSALDAETLAKSGKLPRGFVGRCRSTPAPSTFDSASTRRSTQPTARGGFVYSKPNNAPAHVKPFSSARPSSRNFDIAIYEDEERFELCSKPIPFWTSVGRMQGRALCYILTHVDMVVSSADISAECGLTALHRTNASKYLAALQKFLDVDLFNVIVRKHSTPQLGYRIAKAGWSAYWRSRAATPKESTLYTGKPVDRQ
ncbi:MAG: pentapeptide repeat-containing protein [Phycisphaerae bacterium]|nr:pentapeptide repeat-containing protein [Phycisphaerae bacterium]